MPAEKTHREVKSPKMTARHVADYMAASETAKRSIVQRCKYQSLARVLQHEEARAEASKFLRSSETDANKLRSTAQNLRERLADSDFDRDLFDHNADYLDRLADKVAELVIPDAERLAPGSCPDMTLNGVKVSPQIQFRLSRFTRTNKLRVGAAALRYAKGKALPEEVANWQSAFLFGYLANSGSVGAEPEYALCITIDVYGGAVYKAPSDAIRRFNEMSSALASISERWPNIPPPRNAIL